MNLTLNLSTADAEKIANVSVMGSWDHWGTRMQMEQVTKGQWTATCVVPEGKVRFKFLVDDKWRTGSGYDVEDDGFGGVNNYVFVGQHGVNAAPHQDDDDDHVHVELTASDMAAGTPGAQPVAHLTAADVDVVAEDDDDMPSDLHPEDAQHGQADDKKTDEAGQERKEDGCVIC